MPKVCWEIGGLAGWAGWKWSSEWDTSYLVLDRGLLLLRLISLLGRHVGGCGLSRRTGSRWDKNMRCARSRRRRRRSKRNQTLMQFEKEMENSWTVDGVSQGEGEKKKVKVDDEGRE